MLDALFERHLKVWRLPQGTSAPGRRWGSPQGGVYGDPRGDRRSFNARLLFLFNKLHHTALLRYLPLSQFVFSTRVWVFAAFKFNTDRRAVKV